jgi:hypothetical protein
MANRTLPWAYGFGPTGSFLSRLIAPTQLRLEPEGPSLSSRIDTKRFGRVSTSLPQLLTPSQLFTLFQLFTVSTSSLY